MKQVTSLHAPKPVAIVSSKPWPNQRQVQDLADRLDDGLEFLTAIKQAKSELSNQWITERDLERIEKRLSYFVATGVAKAVERLEDELETIEPEEWCDEDYNVQPAAISKMLAVLVGSFPTSNLPDAGVFTRVLLDDVTALEPGYCQLESACRKIRTKKKFMPAISEILEAIEKEIEEWSNRMAAVLAPEQYQNVMRLLAERRTALAAENIRKASLALPIQVGDRVRHAKFGAGDVAEVSSDGKVISVSFAVGDRRVAISFLEKIEAASSV